MDQRTDDVEIREIPESGISADPNAAPILRSERAGGGAYYPAETVDERIRIETAPNTTYPDDVPERMDALSHDASTTDNTLEIQEDIEQTRARMATTIDALEARLNPQRLKSDAQDAVSDTMQHAKDSAQEAVTNAVQQAKDAVHDATIGRVESMVNNTSNTAKGARTGFVATIRENPLPAALAAIGIGWLVSKTRENMRQQGSVRAQTGTRNYQNTSATTGYQTYPYISGGINTAGYPSSYPSGYTGSYPTSYSSYPNASGSGLGDQMQGRADQLRGQAQNTANQVRGQVQDTANQVRGQAQDTVNNLRGQAQDVANQAQDAAGQAIDRVQGMAGQVSDQAQYQSQRAQSWLQRQLNENPLAVGAFALAAGALVGVSLPETPQEERVLGPARANLLDRAQTAAEDTVQRVQSVAQETAGAAREAIQDVGNTAKDAANDTQNGGTTKDAAQKVAGAAADAVQKTTDAAKGAASK